MRYVIIGNSAAGIFAAEAIRKIDKHGRVDIISDEKYRAYARALITDYISNDLPDDRLQIRLEDFYEKNNFNLHSGQRVVGVDISNKQVQAQSGEVFSYDKLLISTGASPVMPSVPGIESKGVFSVRTLDDCKAIKELVAPGKRAAVIGGGFVSMKVITQLLKTGMAVTCVVSSGQIMSQMLDKKASNLVAGKLSSHGLEIVYGAGMEEILATAGPSGDHMVSGMRLSNGDELPVDLIIVGKGVKPNVEFLRNSKVEIGKGVLVDDCMQTNVAGVYAAGDVAQAHDIISGQRKINAIWPVATEQGMVAGRNMAGVPTTYNGSIPMNSASFFGMPVIAAGRSKTEADAVFEASMLPGGLDSYRKLVFKGDKLVGYILIGNIEKAGLLTALIREQTPLGKAKEELMRGNIRQKALW